MLDVFKNAAFNMVSLTTAINKTPFTPKKLGSMGLFKPKGIATLDAAIDIRNGRISIYKTAARGSKANGHRSASKNVRSFRIPHIPVDFEVTADEVQGVRQFGSENKLETVSGVVAEKMKEVRENMELTFEWHRMGAIHGRVLDGDGTSVVYNWFSEFNITETVVDFAFTSATEDVKQKCTDVIRHIEDALGADVYTNIVAVCGKNFFDELTSHPKVIDAYNRWQDSEHQRVQQGTRKGQGFTFGDITFIEYRASVGSIDFVNDDQCRFFPVGGPNLYEVFFAPANYIETVNTIGKPFYAKQKRQDFDTGIDLQAQSNPMFIPNRVASLIKGTKS